jgi:hypothetical protein
MPKKENNRLAVLRHVVPVMAQNHRAHTTQTDIVFSHKLKERLNFLEHEGWTSDSVHKQQDVDGRLHGTYIHNTVCFYLRGEE